MNDMQGYDVEDLAVGMAATFSKTITETDIVLFAGVSGDNNAIHINDEFAATTRFGGRIAHGFLTASVTIADVDRARARVRLDTVCRVDGVVVIDGHALVMTTSAAKRSAAAERHEREAA